MCLLHLTSFSKTEFAVEMTCLSCVQDVTNVLQGAEGIKKFDIDLKEQRVVVEGSGRLPNRRVDVLQPASVSVLCRCALLFIDISISFIHCFVASMIAPPSSISRLLKNTGKTVIVRGSGVAQGKKNRTRVLICHRSAHFNWATRLFFFCSPFFFLCLCPHFLLSIQCVLDTHT